MSDTVFANGRGIACKKSGGKSIAAFPDVCMSPPSPPAGPIPLPYPNTGMASDVTDGSKTVKIEGAEVVLKNKSYFKKTNGDEAATKSFGANVLSHQLGGKVYFASWSMDVKVEGANVARHMDMTTHNHGSDPPGTPPWMHADVQALKANPKLCEEEKKAAEEKCKKAKPAKDGKGLDCSKAPGCAKAKACVLVPKNQDKKACCAPQTTGHHLVEVHCFTPTGGRGENLRLAPFKNYNPEHAPCMCAHEARDQGSHGIAHSVQGQLEAAHNAGPQLKTFRGAGELRDDGTRGPGVSNWTYGQARDAGCLAHKTANPHCNAACTKKALDAYHNKVGCKDDTPVRSDPAHRSSGKLKPAQQTVVQAEIDRITGSASV